MEFFFCGKCQSCPEFRKHAYCWASSSQHIHSPWPVFLFSFTGWLQGLRIIPTPICLPAQGNLRMFLPVRPYSCLLTLAFIFASLYKLVSDAGLMSLLHAVIRLEQSFNKQFWGLGGEGGVGVPGVKGMYSWVSSVGWMAFFAHVNGRVSLQSALKRLQLYILKNRPFSFDQWVGITTKPSKNMLGACEALFKQNIVMHMRGFS